MATNPQCSRHPSGRSRPCLGASHWCTPALVGRNTTDADRTGAQNDHGQEHPFRSSGSRVARKPLRALDLSFLRGLLPSERPRRPRQDRRILLRSERHVIYAHTARQQHRAQATHAISRQHSFQLVCRSNRKHFGRRSGGDDSCAISLPLRSEAIRLVSRAVERRKCQARPENNATEPWTSICTCLKFFSSPSVRLSSVSLRLLKTRHAFRPAIRVFPNTLWVTPSPKTVAPNTTPPGFNSDFRWANTTLFSNNAPGRQCRT